MNCKKPNIGVYVQKMELGHNVVLLLGWSLLHLLAVHLSCLVTDWQQGLSNSARTAVRSAKFEG